eukprot:SAG25_NODE_14367_length_255_cov_5.230769_1_plen_75_part_01
MVGRHRHRGLGGAAAAASVGWICLLDACLTAGLRQDRRCLLLGLHYKHMFIEMTCERYDEYLDVGYPMIDDDEIT